MLAIFSIIAYLLSVLLPGLVCATILKAGNWKYQLSVGYGLGSAFVALELFLYLVVFRLEFSPWLYGFFSLQTLAAAAWLIRRYKESLRREFILKRPRLVSAALGGLIGIVGILSLAQAVTRPVVAFDAVAFWSMRAQIIQHDGVVSLDPESGSYMASLSHRNYPWQTSLNEYWLRQLGGSGGLVHVIPWGFFAAVTLLLYSFLSSRLKRTAALFMMLLFVTMPLIFYHSFTLYADLVLGYWVAVSALFLLYWLERGVIVHLILSALGVSLAFFTKNEGIFYAVGWTAALTSAYLWTSRRLNLRQAGLAVAALIGPVLPWIIIKFSYGLGLRNTPAASGWYPEVSRPLYEALIGSNNWNVWWFIILGLTLISLPRLWRARTQWPVWIMVVVSALGVIGIYFVSESYLWAIDHTALSRTLIPLVPVSVILAGLALSAVPPAHETDI